MKLCSLINTLWQPTLPQPPMLIVSLPESIFDKFCLCDVGYPCAVTKKNTSEVKQNTRKGTKTIHKYDFSKSIQQLYQTLAPMLGNGLPVTRVAKKSQACATKNISKRRSRFTGVTKNSSNYQTLIVVKGKKIYVESYAKEEHAALTFDFYSMLLHGVKAITNFKYTADIIVSILDAYTANGNSFDPHVVSQMINL